MATIPKPPPGFVLMEDIPPPPPGFIPMPEGSKPEISSGISGNLETFGSEFTKGLGDVLAVPADAVIGLGDVVNRIIGLPETGLSARDAYRELFDMLGITTDRQAQSKVERFIGRMGEELGASVPGVGIVGRAAQLGRTGSRMFGQMVKQFQKTPGRLPASEAVQALSAGVGAQTSKELAPESTLGEMLGQIGGGMAVTVPADVAKGTARLVKRQLFPFTEAGRREIVSEFLQRSASRPEDLSERIGTTAKEVESVLGRPPTTAQAAQDPGLLKTERAISKRTPQAGGKLEDVIIGQRQAVRRQIETAIPPARTQAVPETLEAQVNQAKAKLQTAQEETDAAVRDAINLAKGSRSPEELNRTVRGLILDSEDVAERQAKELFADVDANVKAATSRIKDTADQIAQSATKGEDPESLPAAVRAIRRKAKGEGEDAKDLFEDTEPILEFMGLRSRITKDIRKQAGEASPDRLFISRLERLKEAIDETILSDVPEASEAYKTAREFFKTEVADKFRRGTAARVLQRGRLGEISTVPESATISQFFKKGRGAKEAAEDFKRVFANNTEAQTALREAAIQDFATFGFRPDGTFDRTKGARWVAEHRAALKEFPAVKSQVDYILRKGELWAQAKDRFTQTVELFEKSSARFFLDAEPEIAAQRILNSRKPTAELRDAVTKVRSVPEALRGLRRAIFDAGLRQAETPTFDETTGANFLSPTKLRKFFTQHNKQFVESGLYSKEELAQVDRLIRVAEIVNRSTGVGVMGGSDTAANLQGISTAYGLLGRVIGARIGRIFGTIQSAGFGARLGAKIGDAIGAEKTFRLLEEALYNPKVAQDLLTSVRTAGAEREVGRRIRAHLVNLGLTGTEEEKKK